MTTPTINVERVIRDGKVAVLYSPGYGAGWSTWCEEQHREFALFDRRLVEAVEAGAGTDTIETVVSDALGEDAYFYTGGARDLRIMWLPVGTRFRVEEYDGSESIVTFDDLTWATA